MADTPKQGGTIKLAWIDAVDTLDPHFTSSLGSVKILNNIFNGLLKVSYDGKKVSFVPDLAGMYLLPRLVGLQAAKELAFTDPVSGQPRQFVSHMQLLDWADLSQRSDACVGGL